VLDCKEYRENKRKEKIKKKRKERKEKKRKEKKRKEKRKKVVDTVLLGQKKTCVIRVTRPTLFFPAYPTSFFFSFTKKKKFR
jgi:hypothetical protein